MPDRSRVRDCWPSVAVAGRRDDLVRDPALASYTLEELMAALDGPRRTRRAALLASPDPLASWDKGALVLEIRRRQYALYGVDDRQMALYAASSAPETDFTAKLVDVRPDGYAQDLGRAVLHVACC